MRQASYRFLNRACLRQEILISPWVLREIRNTPDPVERGVIFRRLQDAGPTVISGELRAKEIANEPVEAGAFGKGMLADLTHVAYAVPGRADAVVTWDRRSFARDKVRLAVDVYCRRNGLKAPLISRPDQVALWLGLTTWR